MCTTEYSVGTNQLVCRTFRFGPEDVGPLLIRAQFEFGALTAVITEQRFYSDRSLNRGKFQISEADVAALLSSASLGAQMGERNQPWPQTPMLPQW
jgi:hypothetical protein